MNSKEEINFEEVVEVFDFYGSEDGVSLYTTDGYVSYIEDVLYIWSGLGDADIYSFEVTIKSITHLTTLLEALGVSSFEESSNEH